MEDTWFTSDTHWGHSKIQGFCPNTRVQGSLEEHDELLIKNWNSQVKPHDVVYHLGDFSFLSRGLTHGLLCRLNGRIHLIYGNHDEMLRGEAFKEYFQSRQDYKEIRIDGTKVCMFHVPLHEWHHCHKGAFHLFGHVHSSYGTTGGKSLNVGVDNRPEKDMMLWHWDEIKQFMANKPCKPHH